MVPKIYFNPTFIKKIIKEEYGARENLGNRTPPKCEKNKGRKQGVLLRAACWGTVRFFRFFKIKNDM
jgi:hypothetical protein